MTTSSAAPMGLVKRSVSTNSPNARSSTSSVEDDRTATNQRYTPGYTVMFGDLESDAALRRGVEVTVSLTEAPAAFPRVWGWWRTFGPDCREVQRRDEGRGRRVLDAELPVPRLFAWFG